MIIWLKCTDNNRAEITYKICLHAIDECQCLLQVRSDLGVENELAAKHMLMIRGNDIKGCIGGKPTHNTRIERCWGECNTNAIDFFL